MRVPTRKGITVGLHMQFIDADGYPYYSRGSRRQRKLLFAIFTMACVGFSTQTLIRNSDWQTEEALYRSGIAINPAKGIR